MGCLSSIVRQKYWIQTLLPERILIERIKDGATMAKGRSSNLEDTEHKSSLVGLHLQTDVLTCKLVLNSLVRPVDSGNCRRSPPKTSIPAAISGRPPVRQSALLSDHFGKGCSNDVPQFFRSAPVAGYRENKCNF